MASRPCTTAIHTNTQPLTRTLALSPSATHVCTTTSPTVRSTTNQWPPLDVLSMCGPVHAVDADLWEVPAAQTEIQLAAARSKATSYSSTLSHMGWFADSFVNATRSGMPSSSTSRRVIALALSRRRSAANSVQPSGGRTNQPGLLTGTGRPAALVLVLFVPLCLAYHSSDTPVSESSSCVSPLLAAFQKASSSCTGMRLSSQLWSNSGRGVVISSFFVLVVVPAIQCWSCVV
mmetsp:Transcript_53978/g.141220  ORF Transcript_53978/g.141220 Transcript_53978/m.141220 type:complete len:233 (-) Transcript_53978:526-1224(-)